MSDLPQWGRVARRLFRGVFAPVVFLALVGNALEGVGVDVRDALDRFGLVVAATVVLGVALVGCAAAGLTWLAAEATTGYRRGR